MLKNASTLFGSRLRAGDPCAAASSNNGSAVPARANATVSAPPLSNERREISNALKGAFISASLRGGAQHRANDAIMRTAAAQIAIESVAHLGLRRLWRVPEQPGGAH